jgi:hypothetical protein
MTHFDPEQSQPRPYFALLQTHSEQPELEYLVHALNAIAASLCRIDLRLSQAAESTRAPPRKRASEKKRKKRNST